MPETILEYAPRGTLARYAELTAENERLRQLIKDMVEWNHLHGYPRGSEWEPLEERALATLDQPPPEDV